MTTKTSHRNGALVCAMVGAVVAAVACGPATPAAQSAAPGSSPVSDPRAPAPGTTTANPTGAPTAAQHPESVPPGMMHPPVPTALAAELADLGLDPQHLPPLDKLEGDKLRRVMKLFTRSLGVRCGDCHTDDFAAPTPRKNVASRMWDDFSRGLARADGAPLFCDSCHQGKLQFLDRRDKKALGKWMDDHYVDALRRTDGQEHGCGTCHGDPFEPDFLQIWAKGRAKGKPTKSRT